MRFLIVDDDGNELVIYERTLPPWLRGPRATAAIRWAVRAAAETAIATALAAGEGRAELLSACRDVMADMMRGRDPFECSGDSRITRLSRAIQSAEARS